MLAINIVRFPLLYRVNYFYRLGVNYFCRFALPQEKCYRSGAIASRRCYRSQVVAS